MKYPNDKKGVTLLEIMLYFALLAVCLMVAMRFFIQIANVGQLQNNINELHAGNQILAETLTTAIHTAESVDTPGSIFDNDQGRLSLIMENSAINPTILYIQSGEVFLQEGQSPPVRINPSHIRYTTLRFHKISYNNAPDQIVIDATSQPLFTEISNLAHDLSLHFAVSLRSL